MKTAPDFIIVGAPKAGSTALFRNLGRHPRVFLSPEKEPRHFSYPGRRPDHRGPGDAESTSYIVSDAAAYAALFSGCRADQLAGEATTAYLASEVAAANIARAIPGAKLLVLLRQPVDRAYSEWLHLSRDGRETLPFAEALAAEEERQAAGWGHVWRYAQRGLYATHLRRWLALFPRSQLHLIRYEDLQTRPAEVLDASWRFLGLEPPAAAAPVSRENETSRLPRMRFLHNLLNGENPVRSLARKLLPQSLRSGAKARLTNANLAKQPPLDPEQRRALSVRFHGEIDGLADLTGWKLDDWKR